MFAAFLEILASMRKFRGDGVKSSTAIEPLYCRNQNMPTSLTKRARI